MFPRTATLLAPLAACTLLAAQKPAPPPDVPAAEKEIVQALVGFARHAETYKVPSRAREVYEQVLAHYETDNASARAALGWKRVKNEWQQVTPTDKLPADGATAPQRDTVTKAWRVAAARANKLHRELGLALLAIGDTTRGRHQLERALVFDPDDLGAHQALGHEEIDGFFGSAEQLAFVRRCREVLAKADELRRQDFEVTPLPASAMPPDLKKSGLPFHGAKSAHFRHWVLHSPEAAAETLLFAERALELLKFLLGNRARTDLRPDAVKWFGVLRTHAERDALFAASPALLTKYTLQEAQQFSGIPVPSTSAWAHLAWHDVAIDADKTVAHVTKRCYADTKCVGLGEGLMHAMTWLLCGTTISTYCDVPRTSADRSKFGEHDAKDWTTRLHGEIEAGTDWQLAQIPRERQDNFRDSVRLKAWSFMLWLLARHPDEWPLLVDAVSKPNMMPEDVAAAFRTVLERDIGEVEAEWRDFARAGSRIAKAAGMPQ